MTQVDRSTIPLTLSSCSGLFFYALMLIVFAGCQHNDTSVNHKPNIMIFFFILIGATSILSAPESEGGSNIPPQNEAANTVDSILDSRDGRWYQVIRVDSLYWFNENLAFETDNSAVIDFDVDATHIHVRVYSFADAKTACPSGWRLPSVKEFDHLISSIFDTIYTGLATVPYDWATINANSTGFNFQRTGFLHKRKTLSRESFNLWLEDVDIQNAYHVHMYDTNHKDNSGNLSVFRHTHEKYNPKKNRKFSVRCVCSVHGR